MIYSERQAAAVLADATNALAVDGLPDNQSLNTLPTRAVYDAAPVAVAKSARETENRSAELSDRKHRVEAAIIAAKAELADQTQQRDNAETNVMEAEAVHAIEKAQVRIDALEAEEAALAMVLASRATAVAADAKARKAITAMDTADAALKAVEADLTATVSAAEKQQAAALDAEAARHRDRLNQAILDDRVAASVAKQR